MPFAGRFTIPASHPSLPGHFAGHPIVPGVVLLEEALALLPPGLVLLTAKFTATVHADEIVEVSSTAMTGGRIAFVCHAAGQPVLNGVAGAPG